jgi:hypothetical protein
MAAPRSHAVVPTSAGLHDPGRAAHHGHRFGASATSSSAGTSAASAHGPIQMGKKKNSKLREGLKKAEEKKKQKKKHEHTKNMRPSTRNKHQRGQAQKLLQQQRKAWQNSGTRLSFTAWKKKYWNK